MRMTEQQHENNINEKVADYDNNLTTSAHHNENNVVISAVAGGDPLDVLRSRLSKINDELMKENKFHTDIEKKSLNMECEYLMEQINEKNSFHISYILKKILILRNMMKHIVVVIK